MSGNEQSEGRSANGPSDAELDRATPSSSGGREFRIGSFVILGILAVLTVLFLLTDPATFRGRYMIETDVEDAGGIRRGDPVQMRGVNIGRVHQFEMLPAGVLITLEIDGRWEIPEDSRARLAAGDLLGGRTVEILPGGSPGALPRGGRLPGESVEGIMDFAETVGAEARATMERLRALLDDAAIANVHESLQGAEQLVAELTRITAEQREDLARLTASLGTSAERVEDLVSREELERSIARADSTLAELQTAGGNLARASESLETVMGRIEGGDGTLGRLVNEEELYLNLNTTLEEIQFLARDIRENPGRYIRLRIF